MFTPVFILSILGPDRYLLIPPAMVFFGVPLFDYLLGLNRHNPTTKENTAWGRTAFWAPCLYIYMLTHFLILACGFAKSQEISWSQMSALCLAVGLYTGGLGMIVGHELVHRRGALSTFFADLLLSSVCYQHFNVEHLLGHHFTVSTPDDPATALRGENIYRFFLRSSIGGYSNAWRIEKKRLGAASWGLGNRLYIGHAFSLAFAIGAFAGFGVKGLVFFLGQSLVAISALEFTNYIEHYGLVRRQLTNGRYERVTAKHAWNSSHRFSNALLFNFQRHGDHHASVNSPFTVLKHDEEAPQLPSGYPGMILIALVPALWYRMMHPRLEHWLKSQNADTQL